MYAQDKDIIIIPFNDWGLNQKKKYLKIFIYDD